MQKYNYLRDLKTSISHKIKWLPLFLTFILISCASDEKTANDHLVFRYNEHNNIPTLDPAFAKNQPINWACNQLYNGLVQLDDELNIQPDIATSWTISEDAKTYTFTLRDDIYFHEHELFGKEKTRNVRASDFVYSFNRLWDKKVASPGSWMMNEVAAIKATDQHTLVINLKQPYPAFLGLLASKYFSVVPNEIVEHYKDDFRAHPIGTGPFYFKRWEENIKLVFRKNKRYHEKDDLGNQLPYLEAVAITFLADKQSEFLEFAQGNIDFISGLAPSYKDELLRIDGTLRKKYQPVVNMISGDFLNTEYLGIYMESTVSEFQSLLIRQAINYGFDKQKMVTYLRNGMGTPAVNGFIPKGLPGFGNLKGYDYQPELAKKLVQQFKKETGITSPKITIATNSLYLDLCEYIQKELEKTGLDVTIDLLTSSALRQEKSVGKLDCFRASWIADYPDAENYLSLFYSKNFTPNGSNYTHFKNGYYDSLYTTAMQEVNHDKRIGLYQQMDSIIIAHAPVVPLYYDRVIRFSRKNVKGLGINPINLLHLKKVSKTKL